MCSAVHTCLTGTAALQESYKMLWAVRKILSAWAEGCNFKSPIVRLTGNSRTAIICCVTQASAHVEETKRYHNTAEFLATPTMFILYCAGFAAR